MTNGLIRLASWRQPEYPIGMRTTVHHIILGACPVIGMGCLNTAASSISLLTPPGQLAAPAERVMPAESSKANSEARRVARLGKELLDRNPGLGIRPAFHLLGGPTSEIFHRETYQIYVSEGLATRTTDAQLSALIAEELALSVAERGPIGNGQMTASRWSPIDVPIERGGGTFGPADGTRMAELARLSPRRNSGPALDPKLSRIAEHPLDLAREILRQAGQDPAEVELCRNLSSEAHKESPRRKQLTAIK